MTKFKVDENLPVEVTVMLRQGGHDALSVFDEDLGGAFDSSLASICLSEQRTLLTLDIDFADIRVYPPSEYFGIIVLRLIRQDKPHIMEIVRRLLEPISNEQLSSRLWIVEERKIRVRK
jgi:predicted nuclease of predicted toxin-antitoxin system